MKSSVLPVSVQEDKDGLYFLLPTDDSKKPIQVRPEFKKRTDIGTKSDLLARAIGFKKGSPLKILDLTAGLGRDSFHMACLGCDVTALEAQADIHRVVNDTWLRQSALMKKTPALRFIAAEAGQFLESTAGMFDVIYFDPMFPEKKKSAKPGKESQLLQTLGLSDEANEIAVLWLAKKHAMRVVVKRPRLAPEIGSAKPDVVFRGQAVRYDVYISPKR